MPGSTAPSGTPRQQVAQFAAPQGGEFGQRRQRIELHGAAGFNPNSLGDGGMAGTGYGACSGCTLSR